MRDGTVIYARDLTADSLLHSSTWRCTKKMRMFGGGNYFRLGGVIYEQREDPKLDSLERNPPRSRLVYTLCNILQPCIFLDVISMIQAWLSQVTPRFAKP